MYRTSKDMMLPFSALATFAYVLFWLSQHRFMEQPHHYLTALVIAGWLASLPVVFLHRFLTERRNHHGIFFRVRGGTGGRR